MSLLKQFIKLAPSSRSALGALYHEKVIDHYENPRNVGQLDHFDNPMNVGHLDPKSPNVGTGFVGGTACGDVIKMQIEVDDDEKIIDAKFKSLGFGSDIANSSFASEWIKGKQLEEAAGIKNSNIAKELSLPPSPSLHRFMLAEDAVKAAVKDYKLKKEKRMAAAV